MNSRNALLLRSIRGPVVLMTVGLLALWQQSGFVSLAHTWPLILIVIGVLRLLERLATPTPDPVPPMPPPFPPPPTPPPFSPPPGGYRQ